MKKFERAEDQLEDLERKRSGVWMMDIELKWMLVVLQAGVIDSNIRCLCAETYS